MLIPLYDQGTLVYVIIPDDADISALWREAEAGNIRITGEIK